MFFKEDNTIITIDEDKDLLEDAIKQALSRNLIPKSNPSFFSHLDSTFSFSDITCCSSLFCLVPSLGAAGLGLGYLIIKPFFNYMKNNPNMFDNLGFISPPFLFMILGMGLAFWIWAKSVDRASQWELSTSSGRELGLMAACQNFFSCGTLCISKPKNEEHLYLRRY